MLKLRFDDLGQYSDSLRSKKGEAITVRSKNLWLGIAIEAETKITALLDRLGMTPMNRARVRPTKSDAEDGIKFF